MKKNELFFQSKDKQTNIHMVMWEPEDKVYGVIQVVHGVTEHIMRYEEMAEYFTKGGIAIVGIDLLGHGMSTNNGSKKMYFGPVGSWRYVVEDLDTCFNYAKEVYPDVPYIMLGFSLGSYLARTYLIDYPNKVDGAVIVGTGCVSPLQISLAKNIAIKQEKKFGENNTSPKIKELTFGAYNKKFRPNRTEFDWLCSSNVMLDQYIADPLRGDAMSSGLFREMLDGMKYTGDKNNILRMNKFKPILFLSGTKDPVGDFGKGVNKVYNLFKKCDISDVSIKMYDGLRHDILHEDIRFNIYDDIYGWLRNKMLRSVPVARDEILVNGMKPVVQRQIKIVQKSVADNNTLSKTALVDQNQVVSKVIDNGPTKPENNINNV